MKRSCKMMRTRIAKVMFWGGERGWDTGRPVSLTAPPQLQEYGVSTDAARKVKCDSRSCGSSSLVASVVLSSGGTEFINLRVKMRKRCWKLENSR